MLTSEFVPEMGALIRSLESRVRYDATLRQGDGEDALSEIGDAIVILCALYLSLKAKGIADVR